MALTLQRNRHLLCGRDVAVHRCWPLAAFPPLQLGSECGVRVSMGGVVGEGLRALLAWVVIKELNDESLLSEVLGGRLFGKFGG